MAKIISKVKMQGNRNSLPYLEEYKLAQKHWKATSSISKKIKDVHLITPLTGINNRRNLYTYHTPTQGCSLCIVCVSEN